MSQIFGPDFRNETFMNEWKQLNFYNPEFFFLYDIDFIDNRQYLILHSV